MSTRELAEEAGVNLGAIQYYFGTKAGLFVETIRHLVNRNSGTRSLEEFRGEPRTKREAAFKLADFLFAYFSFLLRPVGPQACRMMYREVLSETAESAELRETLVSTTVSEYISPIHEILGSCVRLIAPQLSASEVELAVQSIVGQCSSYVVHAPFLLRLRGKDFSHSPHFEEAISHVIRFSLRALECEAKLIEEAIAAAFADGGRLLRKVSGGE